MVKNKLCVCVLSQREDKEAECRGGVSSFFGCIDTVDSEPGYLVQAVLWVSRLKSSHLGL